MAFFRKKGSNIKSLFIPKSKSSSTNNIAQVNGEESAHVSLDNSKSKDVHNVQTSTENANEENPITENESACDVIKKRIKQVSEEVCTILSLIPLLSNIEEGREMDKKITDLDSRFQSLLAPVHYYMTVPAPATANAELWDMERQQVNREYESAVANFRASQKMIRLELVKLKSQNRF